MITKYEVLKGFRKSLITESETKELLNGMNYDNDTIELYIDMEKYKLEEEKADEYLKLYEDGFMRGVLTPEQVKDNFGKLNLPSKYQDYLLDSWKLRKEIAPRLPTKAEILDWYSKAVIDEEKTTEFLKGHKYSDEVIELYLTTTKRKVAKS